MSSTGECNYTGGVTCFVVYICLIAANGGLIFGYNVGISGGVTSMDEFIKKFFPKVYRNQKMKHDNQYCQFNSPLLTLFTSALYIAASVASLFASQTTRLYGRKASMIVGGVIFLIGTVLNGAAQNLSVLIIGRVLLGVGIGFVNQLFNFVEFGQSAPVYLSEMALPKMRGAVNMCFSMAVAIGILAANLVNYGTSKMEEDGWRLSLILVGVPGFFMTVGALFIPDTPNSLLERGQTEKARDILRKVRGVDDVEDEFQDLVQASYASKQVKYSWLNILKRQYRPHLVTVLLIPIFQQFTGINVIMFYSPILCKTLGFGNNAAIMSSVITGLVNVVATSISIYTVDKQGRRKLFLQGGTVMFVCQITVGSVIASTFGVSGIGLLSKGKADLTLVFICFYVAAFAWSWGPLGWLVPTEIFPLEIRSAGQCINVAVNMIITFIIGQELLSMLCQMKFGLFFFFAGFIFIMNLFIYFLFPETKNVPMEEVNKVWKAHWFWGKYIPDDVLGLNFQNVRNQGV